MARPPDPPRQPGGLVHAADYAFDFRLLEPRPDTPRMLLVLLHGVGGDECQLVPLASRLPADTLVALPRGQRSISGGQLGWYRVGLSDDGPQVVLEEAEEARGKLVEFIGQLQSRHDLPPARTVVAGFSQGGILGASVALTTPACMAGFAVLCGRLMPEMEPCHASRAEMRHLRALVSHGRHDHILPVEWAKRAARSLEGLGIPHELRLHDAGHELVPAMEDDLVRWFGAAGQPWSSAPAC